MLAIVSHDAGGAEILSSWALQQNEPYCLVVEGPAKSIFNNKLGRFESISLKSAIMQSDWVLTGTSWQSSLEYEAIKLARVSGKKAVTFLDHWVNYSQRFIRENELLLPDEIWVGDATAYSIAKEIFPDTAIVLQKNPYFEEIKEKISGLSKQKSTIPGETYILYVCTPIKEQVLLEHGDERYWSFTEEDAIRYFMKNVQVINFGNKPVVLRPHPSEQTGKYDWALNEFGATVKIGGDKPLLEEIMNADVIAGCNSMAMVIGLIAGKRVINALPPGCKSCSLPMPGIEHLHHLIRQFQH